MDWLKILFYVSAIGLIPIVLSYTMMKGKLLPILYGFRGEAGITHVLKAMSGLYLGNIIVFLLTAVGVIPFKSGLLVLIIFMGGLAFGRLISFVVDKERKIIFILYFIGEVVITTLGIIGLFVV